MASIEDSGSFDHSSNLCGTKFFISFFCFDSPSNDVTCYLFVEVPRAQFVIQQHTAM